MASRIIRTTLCPAQLPRCYRPEDRGRIAGPRQFSRGSERRLDGIGIAPAGGSGSGGDDWATIYGFLATACGWSKPVVDELTLIDLEELYYPYWTDHPPTHVLVAAYLGVGKGEPSAQTALPQSPATTPFNPTELLDARMTERDVHEGLPTPVMDFDELNAHIMAERA